MESCGGLPIDILSVDGGGTEVRILCHGVVVGAGKSIWCAWVSWILW